MRICVAIVFVIWLVLAAMSAQIFRRPIEARLTVAARRALEADGLAMVSVEFDHFDATLSGNVPDLEMKLAAATAVGEVEGVRIRENLVSYGEDPAAHLIFAAGDPVRVSGELRDGGSSLGLGEGFDCSAVGRARRADIPWSGQIGSLAENFFQVVSDGRLEFVGRGVVMAGEVANSSVRWGLTDRIEGLGAYVDRRDQLRVAPPKPFAIKVEVDRGAWRFSGIVRDEVSLDALGGGTPGADTGEISFDPCVAAPVWLWRVTDAIRLCASTAPSASFTLSSEKCTAAAAFPSQFWLEAAERSLRASLPDGIELEMDFQIVRPAIAIGAVAAVQGGARLPISLSVAAGRLLVEGRVRQAAEREVIIAKLRAARSDLSIQAALAVEPNAPELPAITGVLPDVLAFAASGVSGAASLTLDVSAWQFGAVCRDPQFVRAVSRFASAVELFAGIEVDLDLQLDPWHDAAAADVALGQYPIYFKAGSVQISPGQDEKIAHLSDLVASLAASGARSVTLTGCDRGGGHLALQRARLVRRVLGRSEGADPRIDIRAERAAPPAGWDSDRVTARIGIAPAPG